MTLQRSNISQWQTLVKWFVHMIGPSLKKRSQVLSKKRKKMTQRRRKRRRNSQSMKSLTSFLSAVFWTLESLRLLNSHSMLAMECHTMELLFVALKEVLTIRFHFKERAHLCLIDFQLIKLILEKFLTLIVQSKSLWLKMLVKFLMNSTLISVQCHDLA